MFCFFAGYIGQSNKNQMNNKFVLESFRAYLEFTEEKITEGKNDFTLDLNFVKGYVDRILEKQKELASKSSIFSKYSKESNPYDAWLNNYKKMHNLTMMMFELNYFLEKMQ